MAGIIATIIFLGSLCGIGVILFRKIPILDELPIIEEQEQERVEAFTLKKFLAHAKNFYSKMENKANFLLENLKREKKEKKNIEEYENKDQDDEPKKDNYWEELKKFRKKKIKKVKKSPR
ncbi:hypothetical protein KAW43_00660 [Candidatus Parcubacteria bacterium]|nr:hypothetical protein [Candidatus Parcubacteria bacterium]